VAYANNAVLTKDNMVKRKWPGDPTRYFCDHNETLSHLFFQCSTAKAVWAIVAKCIGAQNVPRSFDQCWNGCDKWLPAGKQFHSVGIAAICWAIWKARNKVCFEGKPLINPVSIICHACALMNYWAGLFKELDKEALETGVNLMMKIATSLLGKKRNKDGQLLLKDDETATRRTEELSQDCQRMSQLFEVRILLLVYSGAVNFVCFGP
jgi:hypothetical protein